MANIKINLLDFMKAITQMNVCLTCGSTFSGKTCSVCEATAYTAGDAFTSLCSQCSRGFATSDLNRNLCCFCLIRKGGLYGRNRRTNQAASRRTARTAYQSTGTSSMHPSLSGPGTLGFTRARTSTECTLENAGIRTGEIIAWRTWRLVVVDKRFMLKSMAVDCLWSPGETMTINSVLEQCGAEKDRWLRVPPRIGAGIHAFKTVKDALDNYGGYVHAVYGTVALWGEVIEHERGYRAEFGRLTSIDMLHGAHDNAKASQFLLTGLRQLYGVEGVSAKDFKIGS